MKNNYIAWKLKLIKAGNGEGATILPYIKKHFGYLKYGDAISTILKNTYYKGYFKIELFPQNINNIITYDYIPLSLNAQNIDEASIINEIECFLSMFNNFKDTLTIFSGLRNDFEKGLFTGKYDMSRKALEQISDSFGKSFWLIESEFLLANYTMNVVEIENFYQGIKDECSDYYIKNFVRAIRRKTNIHESVKDSISFIDKKTKDFLNPSKSVEQYKQIYFEFYNNTINTMNYTITYPLLAMSARLNLIDMFLLLEKLIVQIICDDCFLALDKDRLISVLDFFQLPFVFKKSCDMLNGHIDYSDKLTKNIYQFKEQLYNYDVKPDQHHLIQTLEEYPTSFDMIICYAKMDIIYSYANGIEPTLLKFLIEIIKLSLLKEGDYRVFSKVSNDALRLQMLLGSTTLNYGYSNFYYDTFSSNTSQIVKSIFTSDYYNRYIYYYMQPNNSMAAFNEAFGTYESNWFHGVKKICSLLYDKTSEKLMEIDNHETDLEVLHDELEKDQLSTSIIIDNRCCEKMFALYLESNKVSNAIDLYVDLQFKSKLKVCSYNNDLLTKKCNGMRLPTLYKSLNFCIYAHLTDFRGALGLRFNHQCANSLMAILKHNNVTFPSQLVLKSNASNLEKAKYAYLFRHICETDLLTSKLVGNGIDTEDVVEQTKLVLEERKSLLNKALNLDDKYEKKQIAYQIKKIEGEINSLGNISLEDTLISYAKILESAVCVSDTEIILPFYDGFQKIITQTQVYNFENFVSGEFLIFRDLFVKYKKEYIRCLDQQIGINIRHGFLKNEILSYFLKYNIIFEKFPSKEEDVPRAVNKMITKLRSDPEHVYLIKHINIIVDFSKKLYDFIDSLLAKLIIGHTSAATENLFQVFISDESISKIACSLVKTNNPYQFKETLDLMMSEILENNLKWMGEYVEDNIYRICEKIIDETFQDVVNSDAILANNIANVKLNLFELSSKIKRWFEYVKDGNKTCSIYKYFSLLKEKYHYVNYSLSDELPEEIMFYQLHCMDLILSNLIMNATEHSGLGEDELIVNTSVSINKNIMKIYFSNNLHQEIKDMLKRVEQLEYDLNHLNQNNHRAKGNGFKHIVESLNSLKGTEWNLSFCKNELPKCFALVIEIDWRNYIA